MYKILIADAKKQVREMLRISFREKDYEIIEAENGVEALLAISTSKPDIALLELELPLLGGLEICKQVRKNSNLPIVLLVAKGEDYKGVEGLELGADDFLLKPVATREALARVQAILRRAYGVQSKSKLEVLKYKGLAIDMNQQTASAFGHELLLTNKELALLWFLASNPGKAFSRKELLQAIWGEKCFSNTRTVDTHVKRLRQKINAPADAEWEISTIWNVGYKFEMKYKY